MSDSWNYQEQQVTQATWLRSWRQEIFTDYSSNFKIRAHMEELTADTSGNKIASTNKGIVERTLDEVANDQDAIQINILLTKLIKKWYDEDQAKLAATQTIETQTTETQTTETPIS